MRGGWARLGLVTVLVGLSVVPLRAAAAEERPRIRVGSKKFTESYVLGEMARTLLEREGFEVVHKQGMGGTIVLWRALRNGQIDLYPEYTGTIGEQILRDETVSAPAAMRARLGRQGVRMTEPLGFNNTYALVMRESQAERLGIRRIDDLKGHPDLRVGLTHEFLKREDGWGPLTQYYSLQMDEVKGVEHALGYAALKSGTLDLKDAYSTDAKIAEYQLRVLEDNRDFFPRYDAVLLYRAELPTRVVEALKTLEGAIDTETMTRLNSVAENTRNYTHAARRFFEAGAGPAITEGRLESWVRIGGWTLEHLVLVGVSLSLAILVGIPLGIVASRPGPIGQGILGTAGVIQTVPALALLALLVTIPFLGIRPVTAVLALFLYSLLPIVRNTATGLASIPEPIQESAVALGLTPGARLRQVFLPLASPAILAGIKTSAVINVGTATLAALIGAGGLGEPIISGLNLNDPRTILQGALPAAGLAIAVHFLFEGLDHLVVPKGLRIRPEPSYEHE